MEHVESLGDLESVFRKAGNKPVVVDFWATWCGPCQMIGPKFEELSRKYAGKVVFVKVDVDKAKDVAQRYGIQAMPTFLFFHKGVQVGDLRGAQMAKLVQLVDQYSQKYNVFASSKGHSLVGDSAGSVKASSSATGEPRRRNPWADPNFVPLYSKKLEEEKKVEPNLAPSKKVVNSSAPAQSKSLLDEDSILQKAIAMSLEEVDNDSKPSEDLMKVDEKLLQELIEMGFPKARSEKALIVTSNASLDSATDWLVSHADDADIDKPLRSASAGKSKNLERGAPLGVQDGDNVDDADGDLILSIRKKALEEREQLRQQIGVTKSMSEMTKEEKLEYIEKLRAAKKEQNKKVAEKDSKSKEIERRERVKQTLEAKRLREQQEAQRIANLKRKEKEEEKLRRKRILEKINAQKQSKKSTD